MKLFDFDGAPARQETDDDLPMVRQPDGSWKHIARGQRWFTEAMEVDKAHFDKLVAEQDAHRR